VNQLFFYGSFLPKSLIKHSCYAQGSLLLSCSTLPRPLWYGSSSSYRGDLQRQNGLAFWRLVSSMSSCTHVYGLLLPYGLHEQQEASQARTSLKKIKKSLPLGFVPGGMLEKIIKYSICIIRSSASFRCNIIIGNWGIIYQIFPAKKFKKNDWTDQTIHTPPYPQPTTWYI